MSAFEDAVDPLDRQTLALILTLAYDFIEHYGRPMTVAELRAALLKPS